MTKYIAVEWPEYQGFMEHPRFEEECYFCPDSNVYFIPEDMFYEGFDPFELPQEYKENFTIDFNRIRRGQKVLVEDMYNRELLVVEAETNWIGDSMPCVLSCGYIPGINCEIIAVEKEGTQK